MTFGKTTLCIMGLIVPLSLITLCIMLCWAVHFCCNAECIHAVPHYLSVVMLGNLWLREVMLSTNMLRVIMLSSSRLSVVMLSIIALSVVMLSTSMLNVVILSTSMLSILMLSTSMCYSFKSWLWMFALVCNRIGWKGFQITQTL